MQVVFVKQTGHVVAAYTRSADPDGKVPVEQVAGSGIRVRNVRDPDASPSGGESLAIPPKSLDVAVVDFRSDIFRAPLKFAMGGGVVVELGSVTPDPTVFLTSNSITIDLNLTVPPGAPEGIKVWAQVEEVDPGDGSEPERRVVQGQVNQGESVVSISLTTEPEGTPASMPSVPCNLLVLVATYQPMFTTATP